MVTWGPTPEPHRGSSEASMPLVTLVAKNSNSFSTFFISTP